MSFPKLFTRLSVPAWENNHKFYPTRAAVSHNLFGFYLFELEVDPSEEDRFGRHLEEVLNGLSLAQQRHQPGNLLQVDVAEEESLENV